MGFYRIQGKVYTQEQADAFVRRLTDAAKRLGQDPRQVRLRATAKLDGAAGDDREGILVTRGKDGYGTNITRLFDIGVVCVGGRGLGAGEVVVEQAYFDNEIAGPFGMKHPRNFIVGLAGAEDLKAHHHAALKAQVCRFVPYTTLPHRVMSLDDFSARWRELLDVMPAEVPYLCDGVVVEAMDSELKMELGANSKFHRWMCALKRNVETSTGVQDCRLTTGRTGRITPTAILEPVELYGVTVRHATAHTGAHLSRLGLGPGAEVVITRSGGTIPTIVSVTRRSEKEIDLSRCPSCGGATEWDGSYLVCPDAQRCPAQTSRTLQHFFQLNVCKGFGPVACAKLQQTGHTYLPEIYRQGYAGLIRAGLSIGTAKNMAAELERSRREPLSDAVFLASFGIQDLGRGDSRRVLSEIALEDLGGLTAERLAQIHGFGELTSGPIAARLARAWPMIQEMLKLDFNLERTPRGDAAAVQSPIAGMTIVFTGTMTSADRSEMENQARKLGAKVGSAVNGKTTLLVAGLKVGAKKTDAAAALGVRVLDEAGYLALLSG